MSGQSNPTRAARFCSFNARNKVSDARFSCGEDPGFRGMGPNQDQDLGIDEEVFLRSLDLFLGEQPTRAQLFAGIHLAYWLGLGHDLDDLPDNPLILWQMKKEDMPLVDDQGKEAVNFQISISIYCIVAAVLIIVLIGIPLLIGLIIFDLVAIILATIRTNDGQLYRYPFSIRFLK